MCLRFYLALLTFGTFFCIPKNSVSLLKKSAKLIPEFWEKSNLIKNDELKKNLFTCCKISMKTLGNLELILGL